MGFFVKLVKLIARLAVIGIVFIVLINTTFSFLSMFGNYQYKAAYDVAKELLNVININDLEIIFIIKLTINTLVAVVGLSFFINNFMKLFDQIQFFFSDFYISKVSKVKTDDLEYDDLLPRYAKKQVEKPIVVEKSVISKAKSMPPKVEPTQKIIPMKEEHIEKLLYSENKSTNKPIIKIFDTLFNKHKGIEQKNNKPTSSKEDHNKMIDQLDKKELITNKMDIKSSEDKIIIPKQTDQKKVEYKHIEVLPEPKRHNKNIVPTIKSKNSTINEDGFVKSLSLTSLIGLSFGRKKKEEPKKRVINIDM